MTHLWVLVVFLAFPFLLRQTAQATILPYFLAIPDMAEEELPHEHQLDEIAARMNVYRADGIMPESFLTPSFLKYFPVVMELGVLTDVNWNKISGLFVWSPVLLMTYVDNDMLLAMSKQQVWETDTNEGYHP